MKHKKPLLILGLLGFALLVIGIIFLRPQNENDLEVADMSLYENMPIDYVPELEEITPEVVTEYDFIIPVGEARRIRASDFNYNYNDAAIISDEPSIARIVNNGFIVGESPGSSIIRLNEENYLSVLVIEPIHDDFDRIRRNYRASLVPWDIDPNDPLSAQVIASVDAHAERLFQEMNRTFEDGSPDSVLWQLSGAVGTNGFEAATIFGNLLAMTRAFVMPGRFHLCPELFDAIVAGMEFNLNNMFTHRLTASASITQLNYFYPEGHPDRDRISSFAPIRSLNWWHLDIGIPQNSINILTLLYDKGFPPDLMQAYARRLQIFNPNGVTNIISNTTGSPNHQAYKTFAVIMSGVFRRDEERVRRGAAWAFSAGQVVINSGVRFGPNGNGFYWDGSERAHTHFATALAYGVVALNSFARITAAIGGESINGEPLAFNEENYERLMGILDQVYLTAAWRGASMPGLMGRSISRPFAAGTVGWLAGTLAELLPGFPPDSQVIIRQHLKSWIIHEPSIMRSNNLSRNALLREIYEDETILPIEWTGVFAQNHQSRAFYRSEDFVFGISFNNSNANTAPHTATNGENIRGVFAGEGMTYLHLHNDHLQFGGTFFATANFYRLPGTTLELRPDWSWTHGNSGAPNTQPNNRQTFGGTAVLRAEPGGMQNHVGDIGVTGFRQDFLGSTPMGMGSNLTANKSWFMIDGRIIAIGTNITSTTARPVATTIDQRRLAGGMPISFVLGGTQINSVQEHRVTSPVWAHLEYIGSTGYTAQLGWFIPNVGTNRNLTVGLTEQTGRWSYNNHLQSDELFSDIYAILYIEHGTNPQADHYEYVILPNATQEDVERFAAAQMSETPIYRVLYATDTLHAIYDFTQNILMIVNFAYSSAYVTSPVTNIQYTVSSAGIYIIREEQTSDGIYARVVIHDPTGAQESLSVSLYNLDIDIIFADDNITVEGSLITANELQRFQNRRFNSWEASIQVILP